MAPPRPARHRRRAFPQPLGRRGTTLFELIAATMLVGLVLVATMKLLRRTQDGSRNLETRALLTVHASDQLEKELADCHASYSEHPRTVVLVDSDRQLRVESVRLEDRPYGGAPNQWLAVLVRAWEDIDNDSTVDSTEKNVSLGTLFAKPP